MNTDLNTKLILGTANFGNPYGIANSGKALSPQDSKIVVDWAQVNGVNHFDTALAYGQAQEMLGRYLNQSLAPIVDTKLNEESCSSSKSIVETTKKTRETLGVNQIATLYLHNESLLQTSNLREIAVGLNNVLDLGLAREIGVSVYSEAALVACKKALPELTVFQVPENICDRRLISSKVIAKLSEEGNTFILRSIFLQGLLLIDPISIPLNLRLATTGVQDLNEFASINSLSTMELCLAYANSISWAKGIIVGVASLKQLKEIRKTSKTLPSGWDTAIATLPTELTDPRKWST
jgi:aryl-alcohol dehydrogenase-like predicted oxidoreductase